MNLLETDMKRGNLPVSKSEQASTSSAKSRINVPLNLENWKHLEDDDLREHLAWLHQHLLNEDINWDGAAAALG